VSKITHLAMTEPRLYVVGCYGT